VTPLRWAGIMFVVFGIVLISMSHPQERIV
jgi:hypothetical protein